MLQPGEQIIATLILPNITRSESNESDNEIEYNMRNILLEKSCIKCGGETITWPFSENQN